jgi:hypothetical protein
MKNVFFSGANNVGEDQVAGTDTGHGRLDKCKTAIFTGSTAPSRLSTFLRSYVNVAVVDGAANAGNPLANNPDHYANTDVGMPISCVLCIYFSDGMWYLIYQDHNPYNAANMPFNKVPNPYDSGNAL